MDLIFSQVLSEYRDFMKNDSPKSSFLPILQAFCEMGENEYEKIKEEVIEERNRLDKAAISFQQKLREISDGIEENEQLTEIGIEAFLETKKWFNDSIERFQQEYEKNEDKNRSADEDKILRRRIEIVKTDASRLVQTLRDGLDAKIHNCSVFKEEDYENLKMLLKSLNESIHMVNSNVAIVGHDGSEINYCDISNWLRQVNEHLVNLSMKVKQLQGDRKQLFKQETLKFDTYDEKFKYLENKKNSESALEIEIVVGKTIENFVKANRHKKDKLEMGEVRSFVSRINDAWRNALDKELRQKREIFTQDAAEAVKIWEQVKMKLSAPEKISDETTDSEKL